MKSEHRPSRTRARFPFLPGTAERNPPAAAVLLPAELLAGLAEASGELVTRLAGTATLAPVFETKVAAAFACYEMAEAYAALALRLDELGLPVPRRQGADPVRTSSAGWSSLADIVGQRLPPVVGLARDWLARSHRLADWPTVRLLERVCLPCFDSVTTIAARLRDAGLGDADRLAAMADRDSRYRTFNDTRDYRSRPVDAGRDATLQHLVAQVRTQRDELDAIETFARLLAADGGLSPCAVLRLARVVADEARHSIIGEIGLEILDHDPFGVAVGTIGAELRRELDPWEGLAQICLIGEAGNLRDITASADKATQLGQDEVALMLRTIYRDERLHIPFGIALLRDHYGVTVTELQSRILAKTNRFLATRGIPPVTIATAGRLLGE
jgi:hypothetical protein